MKLTGNYHSFEAWQGETFNVELDWVDSDGGAIDLAGKTARMQLRLSPNDDVVLSLTTENGGIIIDDAKPGQIRLYISAETISTVPALAYVYDLEVANQLGEVVKLLWGKFWVLAEVTK